MGDSGGKGKKLEKINRCGRTTAPPIRDAKAGNDIPIPITPEIRKALNLAADAVPDHKPGDLIFVGCS